MALLLLVATIGVGARSYVTADDLYAAAPPCPVGEHYNGYGVALWRGLLTLSRVRIVSLYSPSEGASAFWQSQPATPWGRGITGSQFDRASTLLGFGLITFEHGRGGTQSGDEEKDREWAVQIPLWALAVLFGLPAALWVRGAWRRTRGVRRDRLGLCPACGYDLRSTADRCPECGRPVTAPTAVAETSWVRELRTLGAALVLLLSIGATAAWAGYSHWEHSRFAWAEHDRLEAARKAADQAADAGDATALEAAFGAGAVFTPAEAGEAMLDAIHADRPEVAGVFLNHGADIQVQGGRVLANAIERRMTGLTLRLLDRGADVGAAGGSEDFPRMLPLLMAAYRCTSDAELEIPRRLLARGADPRSRDEPDHMTALHWLANRSEWGENTVAFAQLLLDHGADVNARDGQGLTPLNTAMSWKEVHGNSDLVNFLRSRGGKE